MKGKVIRQIPDDVAAWIDIQAQAIGLNPEAWIRMKLIEMARKEIVLNKDLVQAIQSEVVQAREEGMSNDDIKFMATGAGIRFGRNQGVIGDEVSPEMNAAIMAVVEQELK
jgi:hypothetical protein